MTIEPNDVNSVVEYVISTMLGIDVIPQDAPVRSNHGMWMGRVPLTGSMDTTVVVTLSEELVHQAARQMFGECEKLGDDRMEDVLRELTNVIGGNLAAVSASNTGKRCKIGMPKASHGEDALGHADNIAWFACGGEPMSVRFEPLSMDEGN